MEPICVLVHYEVVIQKILALVVAASMLVGCSTTSGSNTASSATSANSESKMAKCELCGKEFNASELVSHEGKQVCKACKVAHGG